MLFLAATVTGVTKHKQSQTLPWYAGPPVQLALGPPIVCHNNAATQGQQLRNGKALSCR